MSAIELGFGIAFGFFLLPIIIYICVAAFALVVTFLAKVVDVITGNGF